MINRKCILQCLYHFFLHLLHRVQKQRKCGVIVLTLMELGALQGQHILIVQHVELHRGFVIALLGLFCLLPWGKHWRQQRDKHYLHCVQSRKLLFPTFNKKPTVLTMYCVKRAALPRTACQYSAQSSCAAHAQSKSAHTNTEIWPSFSKALTARGDSCSHENMYAHSTSGHMRTCMLTAHWVTWEYVHRKTCRCQNWKLCLIIYRQECSEEACRENKLKRCTWIEKCHKDNKQYSLPHGEYYQLDTSVLEVRAPGLKESFMKSMVNWRRLGKNKQYGRGRQRESQVQENEDRLQR